LFEGGVKVVGAEEEPERWAAVLSKSGSIACAVVPMSGHGASRDYTLPPGWQLGNYPDVAVAGGLLVDSRAHLGIWYQRTGRVRALPGLGLQEPIGSYTPRGAGYSLLAWWPGNCRSVNCPIGITNTASLATVPVRSPFRRGFLPSESGMAFSPDGTKVAVFVNRANGQAEPALVNTKTGTLRVDGRVRLDITELAAWVTWLGGKRLLVGAINQNVWIGDQAGLAATAGRLAEVIERGPCL
jgi:hypothetical protein